MNCGPCFSLKQTNSTRKQWLSMCMVSKITRGRYTNVGYAVVLQLNVL